MTLFKKIVCFCFLLTFYYASVLGQCPSGDIILDSQYDVDNFTANYPNCTEIMGRLRIGVTQGNSNIDDLNNLSSIESVGGDLEIESNYYLTSLAGLENLISIGGDLWIESNANLINLTGLENLTSIDGDLWIESNYDLTNLIGLENLTSIDGNLRIDFNTNLNSLSSLENLTSVGGIWIYGTNIPNLIGLENLTSINGDLAIAGSINLTSLAGLENLTSIGGYLEIRTNYGLTNLTGLENLTSIDGNSWIHENGVLTSLTGLENLTSVGGDLWIKENGTLTSLTGLENLTSIDGLLEIERNDNLISLSSLENLTSIDNGLELVSNDNLIDLSSLGNLTSIGGSVWIRYNDNLTDLSGLGNVTSIEGYLKIQDNLNLTSLIGLESLTSVDGDFWIRGNDNLTSLSALESLTSIGDELSIVGNFTSLTGLESLLSIGGNLSIRCSATNLIGLENLTSIGVSLIISYNDNLTDLSGLENLTSIGGVLRIQDNDNLTNLIGLANVTSFGGLGLWITDNPKLSICTVPFICDYFYNGGLGAVNGNDPFFSDCHDNFDLVNACSVFNRVYADVFYDLNQNGTKEANEPNYYDVSILIEPEFNSYYAPNNGIFYLEPGSYTVTFDESDNLNWELTTDSTSYFVSLEANETEIINFGIYPTQQISHIQTTINSPPARCNERITLDVTTKNIGTTIASGTMWLTIDDAIPDFTFIHQPDTIIEGGINYYGWYFTDLYPGQTIIKNVEVTVPGPPNFELGEQLLFVSFSEFTDINGEDGSEGFRYNPEVRCSYDPNDKLVNPNREGDYVLFEEDFIYTIRFQNTGNDVAYDVVIRDTLDANLDLSTFRLLGSSHANRLNTILSDEGYLTFEFRDIFLPDSTSNFDASQGYVNYLISPFDGLAEETPITNSAGIYFDLNPPVITNTTQSIMVSELPTVSTEMPDNSFDFNILPNPNTGIFTVQNIPIGIYEIHNTSGQIIQEGIMQNDLQIDISSEAQGVYFISVTVDDATSVRRIVKM